MDALSQSLQRLESRYDAVVVGSGYGGGVAACRLAEAGLSVCVLERGREFPAGSFTTGRLAPLRELRLTGKRLALGSKAGLYDFRAGRDIHVLTANGLGGGSLINGAVALRPDERVFDANGWPRALRRDGLLAQALSQAEQMLGAGCCPSPRDLAKFRALERTAAALGLPLATVPATISFAAGKNAAGVEQGACARCGDCWSGCNVDAKRTVAATYLAAAGRRGASVFTLATVRHIAGDGSGSWTVHGEDTVPRPGERKRAAFSVSAGLVVLAAGTLGSTEILLRSRARGLAVSPRLGKGFSANGDEMLIGRDLESPVNAVALGVPPRAAAAPVGPSTIAMLRVDGGDGPVLVQDGTMLPLMAMLAPLKALTGLDPRRALAMLRDGPYAGHRARTQVYYTIAHDRAAGEMRLERDRLIVDWPDLASDPCYALGARAVQQLVEAQGGTMLPNPLSERIFGGRKITVHPLGGCAMGDSAAEGVVDDRCRVFDPRGGDAAVHEGLYVCDGAVVRSSLGVNPLLTITALAERAMTLLLREPCALRHERRAG
jgi:cholesterol oxidase